MENIWQKFTKFSGFAFIFGMVLYAILFLANTFSDYVISERYMNSDIVLVATLFFGFLSIFQNFKINEK